MAAICPECRGVKWTEGRVETTEGGTEVVSYLCQTCGHRKSWPSCCINAAGDFEMCERHSAEWDARSDAEGWTLAAEILEALAKPLKLGVDLPQLDEAVRAAAISARNSAAICRADAERIANRGAE